MSEKPKTVTRRSIHTVTVVHRVGRPGTFETSLEHLTAEHVDIKHDTHEKLGPGLAVKWKDQASVAMVTFIPITNVRSIAYIEREEIEKP